MMTSRLLTAVQRRRLAAGLALAGLLALILGRALPAHAQGQWFELPAGPFAILYQAGFEADARQLAARHGQALDEIYAQFAALYGDSLQPPLAIRFYEDADQFARLNALAPQLGAGVYHAHIGAREIALVAPFPEGLFAGQTIVNAIRHELNGLFLSALSGGGLPPGLEAGLNQYLEVPGAHTLAARDQVAAARAAGQLLPWSELLDSQRVYFDREVAYPQSLSVAAFLVDSYGFAKLIEFARAIPAASGYRAALAQVYGRPVDRLERDWLAYLPDYLDGRWQVNAFFNYDLEPFRAALEAGAYTQVLRGLDHVVPFLRATGQIEPLAEAEALLLTAAQGTRAADLVKAARDALQLGEYDLAVQFAEQAQAAYAALGDASRADEIETYAARAREIVSLRGRLATARALVQTGQLAPAEELVLAAAPRLRSLGDDIGAAEAEALLAEMRGQRQTQARWAGALALAAAALVGARRLYALRRGSRHRPARVL